MAHGYKRLETVSTKDDVYERYPEHFSVWLTVFGEIIPGSVKVREKMY
jgi:hypothetical protein